MEAKGASGAHVGWQEVLGLDGDRRAEQTHLNAEAILYAFDDPVLGRQMRLHLAALIGLTQPAGRQLERKLKWCQ